MSGTVWAVYIRRSSEREGDADVNDETQEAVARHAPRLTVGQVG